MSSSTFAGSSKTDLLKAALVLPTLALAVLGWLPYSASALDPQKSVLQYSLTSWQTDEGLPQNTVRAVRQTLDGYLWIGTQAGLVRFDGVRFSVIDRKTHPGIFLNQHIYTLAVDRRDTLWIGTNGGGLVRYAEGVFERLDLDLPTGRITALAPDASGRLWIGTYGGGVARLDPDGSLSIFDTRHGLPHEVVFGLTLDADGRPWVATYGGGLAHWQGDQHDGGRRDDNRFDVVDTQSGLPDDHVWAVLPSTDGETLWVGTDRGLARHRDGSWTVLTPDDGLPHIRCISLLEDRDGNLWVGTYGGGLSRWDGQRFDTLDSSHGLTSDSIWSLFEDREGLLWAGTLGGGLSRLKNGAFTTLGHESGLASSLSSFLMEDTDGSLWIGTKGQGLSHLRDGRITNLDRDRGFPAEVVWSMVRDREGVLWAATAGQGLLRQDSGGTWQRLDERHHPLLGSSLFQLLEDPDGGLWIGTNEGMLRYRDGGFEAFTQAEGLASDQIRAFALGADGDLWIGTTGGLTHRSRDAAGAQLTHYTQQDGLTSENVWAITPDAEGGLWLGTYGGGLVRFHQGRFTAWTTLDGLPDDDITSVVRDDLGHLWLGASRGIYRVEEQAVARWMEDPEQPLAFATYGRRDGIRSDGGGLSLGLRSRDGRVWFAHFGGVSVIDPATIEPVPAPTVLLERAEVSTGPIPNDGSALPSTSRGYRFVFTAPTLLVPEKIAFRYRLRGFDETWIETDAREVSYSFLEPGEYVFEVMASDEVRRWTGTVERRRFRVAPSFYQTGSFFALCTLGLGLLGLGAHRWRVHQLQRRERLLAQRVDEALAKVKTLRGLLPICSSCKAIRDDAGYWQELEEFLGHHSEAALSHSLCPDCVLEYYPEFSGRLRGQESGELVR